MNKKLILRSALTVAVAAPALAVGTTKLSAGESSAARGAMLEDTWCSSNLGCRGGDIKCATITNPDGSSVTCYQP